MDFKGTRQVFSVLDFLPSHLPVCTVCSVFSVICTGTMKKEFCSVQLLKYNIEVTLMYQNSALRVF